MSSLVDRNVLNQFELQIKYSAIFMIERIEKSLMQHAGEGFPTLQINDVLSLILSRLSSN